MINKERKIYVKKVLSVILSAAILFCLSACGGKTDTDGLYEITLCLDWTPNTNHTGFFVADALGYYKDAGIKIKIVQPPEDGAELMTASGQAQFGVSFQDSLAKMRNIGTMLIVAHRLSTIQHADKIFVMSKGKIVEQGNHSELLEKQGRYYRLYELQYTKNLLLKGANEG